MYASIVVITIILSVRNPKEKNESFMIIVGERIISSNEKKNQAIFCILINTIDNCFLFSFVPIVAQLSV